MVMKVSGVNNIVFRSTQVSTPDSFTPVNKAEKQVKELSNITPDYGVVVPVNYKQTSVDRLDNGLEIYSYKMSNGYKVTVVPMKGSPAVVKSYVNVGSMNETANIKGISHFLEHMAFNGTNGDNGHIELKQGDSFKKIDKIGGWANASTNYAITDYVNSAPLLEEKDLETQIRVIAAMAEDLKLSEDMITKEKGPVSSEINMILDDPQTVAMDQTVRTLFNVKNPADELVGGSVAHIQNLTRKDVVNYYNTYYTPDNTNIVITGDVNPEEVMKLVSKNFTSKKVSKGMKFEEKLIPLNKTIRKDFKSDKTNSAEIVIGFAGPKNNDIKGKILFELASTYLSSHEAGMITKLKKKNAYPIISDEKISTNPNNPRLGFIALAPGEENCENSLKIIFETLGQNRQISSETTERLKQRLKQQNEDVLEHSGSVNNIVGYSVLDNGLDYLTKYNKILEEITPEELSAAIKEYFDVNKAAVTVIHPVADKGLEGTNEAAGVNNNALSFKGKERLPIDTSEISEYKLSNNYDVGFYNTKSNNVNVSMKLYNNVPYTKKAGVTEVLNEIYTIGLKNVSADKFEEFKDKNNLSINATAGNGGIGLMMCGDMENYQLGLAAMKELLYNPNITEENIKKAVSHIKDRMDRTNITSSYIQNQFDNIINPYSFTRSEIYNNLDNITVEDVKELHNYLVKNSRGIVTANIPQKAKNEAKNNILRAISGFKEVEPNVYRPIEIYRDVEQPMVFSFPNFNSQADISQVFRFKYNNTIKEKAVAPVMNSILSGSSIGLFDNLREKQNLAYSVHSDLYSNGNQGQVVLNILTTTDNKDIGEVSYDNVKKSINGFNNQINELISGNFTDEDLDIAKRTIKASLLNIEGNYAKMSAIEAGMDSKYNIELRNKIYKEVDKITKEDVTEFAKKVFSNHPVYSITATQDTLDANKEFLDSLKKK